MCEYCGCQALETIDELTREHDRATELIGRIRIAVAAGDLARARGECGVLAALLGPHTEVEERGLFAAMEGEYADHIETLRGEHAELHAVLAVVEADHGARGGWSPRLLAALTMLRHHILKEQDGVFPAALAALSAADWSAVERVRGEVGSTLTAAR